MTSDCAAEQLVVEFTTAVSGLVVGIVLSLKAAELLRDPSVQM